MRQRDPCQYLTTICGCWFYPPQQLTMEDRLRHSHNLARIWRDAARDALVEAADDLAESVDDVVRARDALEEAERDFVLQHATLVIFTITGAGDVNAPN